MFLRRRPIVEVLVADASLLVSLPTIPQSAHNAHVHLELEGVLQLGTIFRSISNFKIFKSYFLRQYFEKTFQICNTALPTVHYRADDEYPVPVPVVASVILGPPLVGVMFQQKIPNSGWNTG